jgi:hypothetical protein
MKHRLRDIPTGDFRGKLRHYPDYYLKEKKNLGVSNDNGSGNAGSSSVPSSGTGEGSSAPQPATNSRSSTPSSVPSRSDHTQTPLHLKLAPSANRVFAERPHSLLLRNVVRFRDRGVVHHRRCRGWESTRRRENLRVGIATHRLSFVLNVRRK